MREKRSAGAFDWRRGEAPQSTSLPSNENPDQIFVHRAGVYRYPTPRKTARAQPFPIHVPLPRLSIVKYNFPIGLAVAVAFASTFLRTRLRVARFLSCWGLHPSVRLTLSDTRHRHIVIPRFWNCVCEAERGKYHVC